MGALGAKAQLEERHRLKGDAGENTQRTQANCGRMKQITGPKQENKTEDDSMSFSMIDSVIGQQKDRLKINHDIDDVYAFQY